MDLQDAMDLIDDLDGEAMPLPTVIEGDEDLIELLDTQEAEPVTPLYIFDLDGTLAINDHRAHLIAKDREGGPDWDAYFLACTLDTPRMPVVSILCTLLDSGADVWVWSGRGAIAMNETRAWLQSVINADRADEIELCMRREGDFTPDEQLKRAWLHDLSEYDRARLVAVFDDRQKVVDMWRSEGVQCCQVAPGDF